MYHRDTTLLLTMKEMVIVLFIGPLEFILRPDSLAAL